MAAKIKILVTGNEGFIGSNLVPYLMGKGYELYGCDIKNDWDIFNDIEYTVENVDVVIHLAAQVSVEKSFKNPGDTYLTNVGGTARVLYLCNKYNKKLIYPSSAAIYHPDLSPYAGSKKMAEDIVSSCMTNTRATILRLYNVFGPNMNPDSGSIMYNFLTSKEIIIYGEGEQTRDFVHVQDVCKIMEAAISKKWDGKIVDVGIGQSFSVNYIAALFSMFRKVPIEYKTPRREIKWSVSDPTILRMLYKKSMKTDMEKNIKELCKKHQ